MRWSALGPSPSTGDNAELRAPLHTYGDTLGGEDDGLHVALRVHHFDICPSTAGQMASASSIAVSSTTVRIRSEATNEIGSSPLKRTRTQALRSSTVAHSSLAK